MHGAVVILEILRFQRAVRQMRIDGLVDGLVRLVDRVDDALVLVVNGGVAALRNGRSAHQRFFRLRPPIDAQRIGRRHAAGVVFALAGAIEAEQMRRAVQVGWRVAILAGGGGDGGRRRSGR